MRMRYLLLILGLLVLVVGTVAFPGLAGAIVRTVIGSIITLVAVVLIVSSRKRAPKIKS